MISYSVNSIIKTKFHRFYFGNMRLKSVTPFAYHITSHAQSTHTHTHKYTDRMIMVLEISLQENVNNNNE